MVNAPWHYDRTKGGEEAAGKEGESGDEDEAEEIVLDEDGVEVILDEGEEGSKKAKKKRRNSITKCKWLGCDYIGDDVVAVNEHRKVVHLGEFGFWSF